MEGVGEGGGNKKPENKGPGHFTPLVGREQLGNQFKNWTTPTPQEYT
jgi:hypothetical protein